MARLRDLVEDFLHFRSGEGTHNLGTNIASLDGVQNDRVGRDFVVGLRDDDDIVLSLGPEHVLDGDTRRGASLLGGVGALDRVLDVASSVLGKIDERDIGRRGIPPVGPGEIYAKKAPPSPEKRGTG